MEDIFTHMHAHLGHYQGEADQPVVRSSDSSQMEPLGIVSKVFTGQMPFLLANQHCQSTLNKQIS